MKASLNLVAALIALLFLGLLVGACGSTSGSGYKAKPAGSLLNRQPRQQPAKIESSTEPQKLGSLPANGLPGKIITEESESQAPATSQPPLTKVFVEVAELKQTPASLKIPAIKQALAEDSPDKYVYKYKYIYVGKLASAADFSYVDYLSVKGSPEGSYPGDAVVVSENKVYIFSNQFPDPDWFSFPQ